MHCNHHTHNFSHDHQASDHDASLTLTLNLKKSSSMLQAAEEVGLICENCDIVSDCVIVQGSLILIDMD